MTLRWQMLLSSTYMIKKSYGQFVSARDHSSTRGRTGSIYWIVQGESQYGEQLPNKIGRTHALYLLPRRSSPLDAWSICRMCYPPLLRGFLATRLILQDVDAHANHSDAWLELIFGDPPTASQGSSSRERRRRAKRIYKFEAGLGQTHQLRSERHQATAHRLRS